MTRDLEPVFHDTVDQYLRLLGGDSQEPLLDWVTSVTKLDTPSKALFLHGAPGTGKTLLTCGLTRLWTTKHPTRFRDVVAAFNESLAISPLVSVEEGIPEKLRYFIQQQHRTLRRPFRPNKPMTGFLRFLITASNYYPDDIQAIEDLILSINVGNDAAQFLRSLGDELNTFIESDTIAQHALWLRENR